MKRRVLSVLLAASMTLQLMGGVSFAARAEQSPAASRSDLAATETVGGTCGEDVTWTLADGTLTISGQGAMEDYGESDRPWETYTDAITCVVVEEGVTAIGEGAFSYLYAAESIDLPEGLTALGEGALYGCDGLSELTLPASLETVGLWALSELYALKAISVAEGSQHFTAKEGVLFSADGKTLVQFPGGKLDPGEEPELVMLLSDSVSAGRYDIPAGTTTIGHGAFYCCSGLRELNIPDSVTTIEAYALSGCYRLNRLVLPAGLERVGEYGFESMTGNVIFRGDAPVLEENAFAYADVMGYYPGDKEGWEEVVQADYDGTVTWVDSNSLRGESETLNWSLDPVSGLLTLSGEGAMPDYDADNPAPWYDSRDVIRSIEMEGLTTVGNYAFAECSNLKKISLPDELTAIGEGSFWWCNNLEAVDLPETLESIGSNAFRYCYALTQMEVPASVTEVGEYAFQGCGLEKIVFLGDAPVFGENAFEDVYGLGYYPAGNESWTQDVLDACKGNMFWLASGTMPGGTCGDGLSWSLNVDSGLLTISGEGAMYDYSWEEMAPWANCSQWIETVQVTEGVTSIGNRAFGDCWGLTSIDLADSVISIGAGAFSSCGMEEIELPVGLTSLGDEAFAYCGGLTGITLPVGVTRVGDSLFHSCSSLKQVTMLGPVTDIGEGAFQYCSELTEIDLPDTVTTIGASAFSECSNLTEITLPAGVTQLSDNLFEWCYALERVTMLGDVTAIGERAFTSTALMGIDLPDTLTSFGNYAFLYCANLKEITLPAGVTAISYGMFENCAALERVTFLGEITTIDNYAFYGCTALDLEIPATVTDLGMYAFFGAGLTRVTVPAGVKTLKHSLFRNCAKLKSVTVPASVTTVEEYVFANSTLEEVSFLGGPPYITTSSFSGVTATAYYNDDYYWSAGKKGHYGGTLTWKVYSPTSGTCGENLTWTFDRESGVLTIMGDGTMEEVYATDVPWYNFRKDITAVVFQGAPTTISQYAFHECTALKEISIPDSVTTLSYYAFDNSGLESVTLPASVATLYDQVFSRCSSLKEIQVAEANESYSSRDGVLFNKDGTTLVQYPNGRAGSTYTIPDGVTKVQSYAFYRNKNLAEVNFPASMTTLESHSFEDSALKQVDLSHTGVTSANAAFRDCTALERADLSGTKIYSLYQVFAGCTALRGLWLPAGLYSVSDLGDCTQLDYLVVTGSSIPELYSSNDIGSTSVQVFYPWGTDLPESSVWVSFALKPYAICEDRSYYPFPAAGYEDAAEMAEHMGGHLAAVTDQEEELLLQDLVRDAGVDGFWAGGTLEEGEWTWTTGEDWLFARWAQDEPGENGHCLYLGEEGWSAGDGSELLPFLVEIPATEEDWMEDCLTDGVITIDETGMITGVIGSPTQITIPARIGGVDVVDLCPGVLSACGSLAAVSVEAGNTAFRAENGLLYTADGGTLLLCPPAAGEEVTVAQWVHTVECDAFANCTALEKIWFTGDAPSAPEDMLEDCPAVLYYPEGRYGWSTPTWNGFAAEPYEPDTNVAYFLVEGGSVGYDKTAGQIVSYSAAPTLVYIPGEVDGVAITGIAAGAFAGCTSLETVYVPDSVTAIADDAFSGCGDELTLCGGSGSAARNWAETAGLAFVVCAVKDVTPADRSSVGGDSLTITLRLTSSRADVPVALSCTDGDGAACDVDYSVRSKIASGFRVYTLEVDLTGLETGEYAFALGSEDYGAEARVVYAVDRTPPGAVTGLTVTPGALVNVITWERAAEANTVSYQIYRGPSSDGEFELLTTVAGRDTLYYNDKDVEVGTEYFYRLTATDEYGQVSPLCLPASGIPHADDQAPRITGISPANGSTLHGTVQIMVTAQDNVQMESITLETSPDGAEWTVLETISTGNSALFTLDTTQWTNRVFIRVSAADASGNVGWAATEYEYAVDNTPPAQVTGLWGESGSTIITLHWDDVPDQDFAYFRVEEKKEDGSFVFVSRVTGALGVNLTGLAPAVSHTYRVRAVDQVGNEGPWSAELTVSTQADAIAPVIASISPASGRVTGTLSLSFGVSDDYGVASLLVQTSRNGKDWTDAGTVTVDRVKTYQYVGYSLDTTVLDEGLLYVRAIATDPAGNVGDSSEDAPYHQYYIDRTAPAAPTGVSAVPEDGAITVRWEQGSEEDLYTYSVYRADGEAGPYTRVASGLQKLYWRDSSVSYGNTYFYRVAVQDRVGNLSGMSDTVSAQPKADTTAPTVVSVSPSEGYNLSASTTIRAKVHDNNRVATLFYAVSTDDAAWQEYSVSVNSSDTTLVVPVNLAQLNADAFRLKVWCVDVSGNISAEMTRSYTLDMTPPAVPELTVTVEDMTAVLSWSGGTETDLAGYKVYRAAGEGGSYSYLLQRSGGSDQYTYTDSNLNLGVAYSYCLEAIDRSGNTARGQASEFVIPVDRDEVAPQAVIEGSRVGTTGVEIAFRGSGSTDNVAVTAYEWDFGDGGTSNLRTPAHAYTQAGSYTVTLSVYDAAGNHDRATLDVTVKDPVAMGTLKVVVTDENGSPLANAGVYLDLGSEEQCIVYTNVRGEATMAAAAGEHVVGVYTTGYLPAKETVEIIANAATELAISVVEKDLVVGELSVRRMTLEEIVAAGISVSDPANQEIFEYTIQLTYGAYQETVTTYYNWNGTALSDPPYLSLTDSNGEKRNVTLNLVSTKRGEVSYNPVEEPPLVVVLDLPGTASWLKDFFEVRLTVINQAEEEFVLDDCVAQLDLPAGLTLMNTSYTSASTVCGMGSIPGQSAKSAYWVIRGDKAGDYDLSADFTAVLRDFGKTINATFTTASPFTVRQNRGLTLDIVAENAIVADTDGAIRVGLRNDDSAPYYMPNVQLDEQLVEWVETFKTDGRVKVDTSMDVLYPGETLWSDYIIPRANWESLTYWEGEDFYLMDAIVKATGGTTTLPYTIEEVMPFTIAADLIVVTKVEHNGTESDITYINAKKADFLTADIPTMVVRTYRLNSEQQYEPCSMDVLIRDGYRDKDGEGTTVTTDANGRYVMSGYTVETLENDKSYTIRFSARRAQPVEIPVVIRGDTSPTGNLDVYVYEDVDGEKVPVVGAQVSITGTGLSSLTGEKGGAAFTYVDKGKQEVVISAGGFFTLTELVEVEDDETQVYFRLSRDLNPDGSCITRVSNTLSSDTQGNRVVIPEGRVTGSIDFHFNIRIAEGEQKAGYLYRILRNNQVAESGSFTSDTFLLRLDTMKKGDVLQFALETERDGQSIVSPYMDSGVIFAPVPHPLSNLVYSLLQVNKDVEVSMKGEPFEFEPSKTYHWESPIEKTVEKIPNTNLSEKGQLLTKEVNKMTIEDSKTKWTFPLKAKYDPSGKLTITAQLGRSKEGTVYNNTVTSKYYRDAPINMSVVRHGELVDVPSKGFSVGLEIVMQYDAGQDDWDMKMYLTQDGEIEMEIAKFTVLGVGYLKIEGTLEESAKWALVETGVGLDESVVVLADGLKPKTGEIGLDVKGAIGAQAFTDKLASADVYVKSGVTVKLFPNPKALLEASVGGEASFLVWGAEKDFIHEAWEVSLGSSGSSPISLSQLFSEEGTELTLPVPAEEPGWTGSLSGDLLTQSYGQVQPQMARLPDGTALLVWEDYTGDEFNPVALYWARFDGERWTQPARVDEDGTADLYPCLVATEEGARLVWTDFNRALTAEMASLTYAEVETLAGTLLDVSVAEFDAETGAWTGAATVEKTGIAVRPCVVLDRAGRTVVAWLGNEAGLAQGTAQSHDCVGWAVLEDGQVIDRGEVELPVPNALDLALGCGTSGVRLAVLAGDGSGVNRVYESYLFAEGWTEPEPAHSLTQSDDGMCMDPDGTLYFINSGRLYRKTTGTLNRLLTSDLLGEGAGELTWAEMEQGAALLWSAPVGEGSTICMVRLEEDGAVYQPVVLERQADALLSAPAAAEVDGDMWLIYRHSALTEDSWRSGLRIGKASGGVDLALEAERVVHSNYLIPGAVIATSAEVTSLGLTSPDAFELVVAKDRAGRDVIDSVVGAYGMTATLEWTVPADYRGEELYLLVKPGDGEDLDPDNNAIALTNVVREVAIGRTRYIGRMGEKDLFTTRVENLGLVESGMIDLTVTAGEEERVVHQIALDSLAAGTSRILTLEVDALDDRARQELTFALSIPGWEGDPTDNKDFLTLPAAGERAAEPGVIVTEGLWLNGADEQVETLPEGIVRARLKLENLSSAAEQVSLMLAAYDDQGQMLTVGMAQATVDGEGQSELVCDLDLSRLEAVCVKAFLLDSGSGPVTAFEALEK